MTHLALQSPQPSPQPLAKDFNISSALEPLILLAIPFFLFLVWLSRVRKPLSQSDTSSKRSWTRSAKPIASLNLMSSVLATPIHSASFSHPHYPWIKSTTHSLYNQILRRLDGDYFTADCLLQLTRNQYPQRSDHWHYQKVLEDLMCDRN